MPNRSTLSSAEREMKLAKEICKAQGKQRPLTMERVMDYVIRSEPYIRQRPRTPSSRYWW